MNKKGFTLIELLVVIAIIGILSSVVLASLNTARNKGADAKVQSQMSGIRAAAELNYDGTKYGTATAANNCGDLFTSTNLSTLVTAANWPDTTAPTCTSNATGATAITAYAMSHALNASGSYYCVDSTGASVKTTTAVATGKNCAGGNL
jgi:prepilin-type N-terminal cleavage/methylation domain-containing protein